MKVLKAGCILIDIKNKKIGLVYREKRNDYSFPKGHLEEGETLEECAIRETEEETGMICKIIKTKELPVIRYTDSNGNDVEIYHYFGVCKGISTNNFKPEDVEELVWMEIDEVEDTLTYQSLKNLWNEARPILDDILNKIIL